MGIEAADKKCFKFPARERLKSKKQIDELFLKGESFFLYPFSVKYLMQSNADCNHHQLLVSVSKKKFKKAVDRNKIKRRIKEAYRLNKVEFLSQGGEKRYFLIAYIYIAKEIHDYRFIESKLIESLERLNSKQINSQ